MTCVSLGQDADEPCEAGSAAVHADERLAWSVLTSLLFDAEPGKEYITSDRVIGDRKGERGSFGRSDAGSVEGVGRQILVGLSDHRHLFRVRARHRGGSQDQDAILRGLLPLRAHPAELGYGACLPGGEFGGHRDPGHGSRRGPVRADAVPLLLGRRDTGDGVHRLVHDPVLLREQGPLGAWLPEAPLQRGDQGFQRDHVRHLHDTARRHQHVRHGHRVPAAPRMEHYGEHPPLRRDIPPSTSPWAASPLRSTTRSCSSSS